MIEKSYLVMADDSNGIMSFTLWMFMDVSSQQPAAESFNGVALFGRAGLGARRCSF
jgi:hypothetical protein